MLCVGIIFIKIFTDEVNPPIRLTVAALRMHNTSEVAGISPISAKEGANKQVISSQVDSLIKISRIWANFFPANTSNQPI